MSWLDRTIARLVDWVDETATRTSTPTRDYNERVINRDTRRQIRDEIETGQHQPSNRLERGWAEHTNRKDYRS